jgi:acetylornithine deacetylase/succinyl-diaminopimelate desuccinylase-like protein
VDPFAGIVRDGYVYGRGAVDDKDMVAASLVVLMTIHRQQLPLDRDVIFVAEAGEEGTPQVGIDFLIRQHWNRISAEYALAEGGTTSIRDGRVEYVGVATTEKVPRGLRLIARGSSGHGSVPRPDNPIVRLAAAVAKAGAWRTPIRLNDTTRAFFRRMAVISPPAVAALLGRLEDPSAAATIGDELATEYLAYNTMLRTSIAPTMVKGGFRTNVIPAEAEAYLDVRALPDEDMDRFIEELKHVIDDPSIEVVRMAGSSRMAAPPSRLDSEMFRALERVQQQMFPGAITVPMMLAGATDMAQLRAKGVQAYGLSAPATESEQTAHGNDERISIEGLGQFVEFIYRTVVQVAGEGVES